MSERTTTTQSVVVPKFGDIVENGWASEDNPTRRGFFVREFKRTGKMNPGRTWEITDGKGKFWEFKPSDIGERLAVSAAPAPSSLAGGEVWKNDVEWLRECSRYFLKRDTKGEDSAFWSNMKNSENATRIADRLAALSPEARDAAD